MFSLVKNYKKLFLMCVRNEFDEVLGGGEDGVDGINIGDGGDKNRINSQVEEILEIITPEYGNKITISDGKIIRINGTIIENKELLELANNLPSNEEIEQEPLNYKASLDEMKYKLRSIGGETGDTMEYRAVEGLLEEKEFIMNRVLKNKEPKLAKIIEISNSIYDKTVPNDEILQIITDNPKIKDNKVYIKIMQNSFFGLLRDVPLPKKLKEKFEPYVNEKTFYSDEEFVENMYRRISFIISTDLDYYTGEDISELIELFLNNNRTPELNKIIEDGIVDSLNKIDLASLIRGGGTTKEISFIRKIYLENLSDIDTDKEILRRILNKVRFLNGKSIEEKISFFLGEK